MMMGYSRPESKPAKQSPLLPPLRTEEPSLSELNPLFNAVELHVPSSFEAFKTVTLSLIDRYGGLKPDVLKSMVIPGDTPQQVPVYRFTARFEVDNLTERKIHYLEELIKYAYGSDARTRKSSDGVDIPTVKYPHADIPSVDDILNTRLEGWYMGLNTTPLTAQHMGLYLFRDVGITNSKNFTKASPARRPKFVVEIREASMFQTDLANLVVETATILGKGRPIDYGKLMYDTYYELMRGGLKKETEGYNLDAILQPVQRGLILPLANPKLAEAITQEPESALLCGVAGTGKSLAARKLFYQDTGVFVVPLDPMQLAKDIELPPEKRVILPRIAQIRVLSQRPVILQLDDVEKLFDKQNKTSSALLNLMAGVQEQGFYVLASTNEPEQIDTALLQPQRLGIRVYCPLPAEDARLQILRMHTPMYTPGGAALFNSAEDRDLILEYISNQTGGFPPRQLGKVATNTKSILLERVSQKRDKVLGLTEDDLDGATFEPEDWEEALLKTLQTFDIKSTKKRDEEIRDFVIHHEKGDLGFLGNSTKPRRSSGEVRKRMAAKHTNPGISA